MRPLVLLRLAQARQDRYGCSLRAALLSLAPRSQIEGAMRRIFAASRYL